MSWRRSLAKLRSLLGRTPDDLSEEIGAHLAMEEAENLAEGMNPEEARRLAKHRFGNVTLTEERSRDMWKWTAIEAFGPKRFLGTSLSCAAGESGAVAGVRERGVEILELGSESPSSSSRANESFPLVVFFFFFGCF